MVMHRCPTCGRSRDAGEAREGVAGDAPVVRVGVVVRRPGEVLLVRAREEDGSERWCLPAGPCRRDELPETVATRHVRRLTGLLVRLTGLLDVLALHERGELLVVYDAAEVDGDLLPGEDALEAAFHPLDALPPVAPAPVRHLLSRLATGVPRRW